jgi:hypothetical protein
MLLLLGHFDETNQFSRLPLELIEQLSYLVAPTYGDEPKVNFNSLFFSMNKVISNKCQLSRIGFSEQDDVAAETNHPKFR